MCSVFLWWCIPKDPKGNRNIIFCDDPCTLGIVHIVVDVRDLICIPHYLPLQGSRISAGTMIEDAVSYLPGKV